jgi:hypothetical protein
MQGPFGGGAPYQGKPLASGAPIVEHTVKTKGRVIRMQTQRQLLRRRRSRDDEEDEEEEAEAIDAEEEDLQEALWEEDEAEEPGPVHPHEETSSSHKAKTAVTRQGKIHLEEAHETADHGNDSFAHPFCKDGRAGHVLRLNLASWKQVERLFLEYDFDEIFHAESPIDPLSPVPPATPLLSTIFPEELLELARNSTSLFHNITAGTANLLRAARHRPGLKPQRFILASSTAIHENFLKGGVSSREAGGRRTGVRRGVFGNCCSLSLSPFTLLSRLLSSIVWSD